LTLEDSDLDLIEAWVKSWGHHHIGVLFSSVLADLCLLISLTRNRDGYFQIAGNVSKIFTVRVTESQPLVEHGVVLHEVDET